MSQNPFPLTPEQLQALQQFAASLNPEQRIWVSGFMAGNAMSGGQASQAPAGGGKKVPLTILFGTESGNAEALADDAKKLAAKKGFKPTVVDMFDITPEDLTKYENLIVILSTWGEGDPPERAESFYSALMEGDAVKLSDKNQFALLALGDSSYVDFCGCGKKVDARLEELGAKRIHDRLDCDLDYEEPAAEWLDAVINQYAELNRVEAANDVSPAPMDLGNLLGGVQSTEYSKTNPFLAEVNERVMLNDEGSNKENWHVELSLEGSGMSYLPGDALGIVPENDPEMVEEILKATDLTGSETVEGTTIKELLAHEYDINAITKPVIEKYAELTGDAKVKKLAENGSLQDYIEGREIIDLLTDYKAKGIKPEELLGILRKLPPRLYSIASSQAEVGEEVHLTIGAVRYHTNGRNRKGVTSGYIADQVKKGDQVKVYLKPNKHFRLPEDPSKDVIMIGPGTGIAPFRAFLQHRQAEGAKGRNWLFFGDQHYLTDFLYQIEWQSFLKDGLLTKMDVAFSRDNPKQKVYVQHKMWEHRKDFYDWLENGASLYICGDEKHMAKDVDKMLHEIIADQSGKGIVEAGDYVKALKQDGRYLKDVY